MKFSKLYMGNNGFMLKLWNIPKDWNPDKWIKQTAIPQKYTDKFPKYMDKSLKQTDKIFEYNNRHKKSLEIGTNPVINHVHVVSAVNCLSLMHLKIGI
ncbi:hypothetical protein ACF5W4_08520 [Bacillota bacterium Lsc_1132]